MPHKATTVRLEPALQQGLETLSKTLKRPMNQLINEALHDYVSRRSHDVERDLKKTLTALRAYRRRDSSFKATIASAARAEAEHGHSDPLDGQLAAILETCAWVHAEWIRIHPFANGNGRTTRLWVNSIAMRGNWQPTVLELRLLLNDFLRIAPPDF